MFSGPEIAETLTDLGVTHVVWLPDSELGKWEQDLESSPLHLVRVCREGEAWPLAAGLQVAGAFPVVMMQTTGLFESGDALRNVLFDLRVPLFSIIGARNWLNDNSRDSAKRFAQPILDAWNLDYQLIAEPADKPGLATHYLACRQSAIPGVVVLAEGVG